MTEVRFNPLWIPVRSSPVEVMLIRGPFSRMYLRLTFSSIESTDAFLNLALSRTSLSTEELASRLEELGNTQALDEVEQWKRMGVLIPASAPPAHASLVGACLDVQRSVLLFTDQGKLGTLVQTDLKALGIAFTALPVSSGEYEDYPDGSGSEGQLSVLVLDTWIPDLIRRHNHATRERGHDFLPIYLVPDGGVIGPLATGSTAGYLSFERQWAARMSSWMAWRAWYLYAQEASVEISIDQPQAPFVGWFGHLAAILLARALAGERTLVNTCVMVDFASLFIDAVRVYLHPAEMDASAPRSEF